MIKYGTNNIGKIFFGGNTIGKAYLGSNLVYDSGSGPGPQPTTNIAYIRGGADGSYIDTGITANNTVKVIVWARNWNPQGGALFGSSVSDSSGNFAITASTGAQTGNIRIQYAASVATIATDQFANLSGYHKYELYQGVLKIDDVTIATGQTGSFNGLNIHLFGRNLNGSHATTTCPIDICSCKIYKNDVLVRDFTAVNTPSVGLYDSISGDVFTNDGSGSLIYGTFNKLAYTPLEYIESTGGSYIQTSISANYGMRAVACFMPTGTDTRFYRFVGARDSNPTKIFEIATGNASKRNSILYLTFAASAATAYNSRTADYFKNKKVVASKNNNTLEAYINNAKVGSTITGSTDTTYTVNNPVMIFNSNGVSSQEFVGRGYYVLLGGNSFVPALVNSVAGLYDTYNDVFYPSASSTPFIAGPTL